MVSRSSFEFVGGAGLPELMVLAECNVGYAFVNFIDVNDLLAFAQEKLNVKW
jgi:hypothetical protein